MFSFKRKRTAMLERGKNRTPPPKLLGGGGKGPRRPRGEANESIITKRHCGEKDNSRACVWGGGGEASFLEEKKKDARQEKKRFNAVSTERGP